MNYYLLIATITLIIQVIVIAMVLIGFEFKRRLKYRWHGLFMSSALIVHLVLVIGIMVPSFLIGIVPIIITQPTGFLSIISPIHVLIGSVTAILGLRIVLSWRFRESMNFCLPRKRLMLPTLLFWLTTLVLGVVLYLALNWSFLFG